jgi:hypothetical protein
MQAALDAAKQLSSIWKTALLPKLLQRPPAVALVGKAAEAVDQSIALLHTLHSGLTQSHASDDNVASTQQLLNGLEQHQLAGLLARLTVWLQHRPEVRLELSASSSSKCMVLWQTCITVLRKFANILMRMVARVWYGRPDARAEVMPYIEGYTCALDKAGADPGSSVLRNLHGYLCSSSCCAVSMCGGLLVLSHRGAALH